ncbi:MAG: hypothetical protein EOO99_02240 [Pedobacter sp.]|nr:MAG: hypothetical protein EOO99_02240 [Pedobacter sp.]
MFSKIKNIGLGLCCLGIMACQQPPGSSPLDNVSKDSTPATDSFSQDSASAIVVDLDLDTVKSAPTNLAQIRSYYAYTKAKLDSRALDSTVMKYNCQNERQGTITYYSHHGKLLLISHQYNEYDHFQASELFYVFDNAVYFIYQRETNWSFVSGSASQGETRDEILEKRTYFNGAKPLHCLEKKYTLYSNAKTATNPSEIPNKSVTCKNIDKLLKRFEQIHQFKTSRSGACLSN